MADVLFVLGGSVFAAMGLLHAVYTFTDARHPRRLVPDDPAVTEAMRASGVRMARGGTTMWRAWVGFNLSHSLGAVVYGACCIFLGVASRSPALPRTALVLPVAVGVLYLWLALRYWFRAPAIGIALGTTMLSIGALLS